MPLGFEPLNWNLQKLLGFGQPFALSSLLHVPMAIAPGIGNPGSWIVRGLRLGAGVGARSKPPRT